MTLLPHHRLLMLQHMTDLEITAAEHDLAIAQLVQRKRRRRYWAEILAHKKASLWPVWAAHQWGQIRRCSCTMPLWLYKSHVTYMLYVSDISRRCMYHTQLPPYQMYSNQPAYNEVADTQRDRQTYKHQHYNNLACEVNKSSDTLSGVLS